MCSYVSLSEVVIREKMPFLTLRIMSNSSQTQFSITATAVKDTQGTDDITYRRSQVVQYYSHLLWILLLYSHMY